MEHLLLSYPTRRLSTDSSNLVVPKLSFMIYLCVWLVTEQNSGTLDKHCGPVMNGKRCHILSVCPWLRPCACGECVWRGRPKQSIFIVLLPSNGNGPQRLRPPSARPCLPVPSCHALETDRNPNFHYLPKQNILHFQNAEYSANTEYSAEYLIFC